jgi:putative flippase GtrA
MKEWIRSLKFLLFSVSAGIIQIGLFTLLNELLLPGHYWLSYLIALVASVLWNFTFNRRYTFKSDGNVARAMLLVAGYYCVFTPLSVWLEAWLTADMLWNEYLVTGINMLLNFTTEFLFQRFVVYRNEIDTKK